MNWCNFHEWLNSHQQVTFIFLHTRWCRMPHLFQQVSTYNLHSVQDSNCCVWDAWYPLLHAIHQCLLMSFNVSFDISFNVSFYVSFIISFHISFVLQDMPSSSPPPVWLLPSAVPSRLHEPPYHLPTHGQVDVSEPPWICPGKWSRQIFNFWW